MYEIDSRCPCCAAPLAAIVTVEDMGGDPQHGHTYDVSLELAPAQAQAGPEACVVCENPFTLEGERLACEASRRRTA